MSLNPQQVLQPGQRTVLACLLLAIVAVLLFAGCQKSARMHYTSAQVAQGNADWGTALEEYEAILAMRPDDAMAMLGKGRALYNLRRFEEAIPLFEKFLEKTKGEQATFKTERYDAQFFMDKCKQELGQEVQADPSKIPEPPMGE